MLEELQTCIHAKWGKVMVHGFVTKDLATEASQENVKKKKKTKLDFVRTKIGSQSTLSLQ